METLILLIDAAAVVMVVLYSLRNDKRPGDGEEIGPFRLAKLPVVVAATKKAAPPPGRRRTRGA